MPAIGKAALESSRAGRAAIYVRDDAGAVVCHWSSGLSDTFRARIIDDPRDLPGMVLGAAAAAGFLALPDGRLVNGRKPFLCADVETLPPDSIIRQRAVHEGYRAVGIWPLTYDGQVRAVISCHYDQPRTWSHEEEDAFSAFARQAAVVLQTAELIQRLRHGYARTAIALARAVDAHGGEPGSRAARLVGLAAATAGTLGCSGDDVEDVRWGARLYDIGMAAVPDEISMKPDRLTAQEWAIVRQHPVIGEEVLRSIEQLHRAAELVRHHQERWDGGGYPDGLRGEQIPLGSRTLAVLEAYAAMTQPRPYRPARRSEDIVGELRRRAGTQFDPKVVDAFCAVLEGDGPEPGQPASVWASADYLLPLGAAASAANPAHPALDKRLLGALRALPDGARQLVHTVDIEELEVEVEEHLAGVGHWSLHLAGAAGVPPDRQDLLAQAALVHDIGKLGLSRTLLRKPGALSSEERALLVQHVNKGVILLRTLDVDEAVVEIVAAHHERWDGAGYPQGLAGEAIPFEARILVIADAFDAMTSPRVYHRIRTREEAVLELRRGAGSQFDPHLVEIFISILEKRG
ncbi:MAG: GAF and HD-GYP domain-containing protein [bacterium]